MSDNTFTIKGIIEVNNENINKIFENPLFEKKKYSKNMQVGEIAYKRSIEIVTKFCLNRLVLALDLLES
jgi:hypothetical protein